MSVTATYLGANGWILNVEGIKIVIDPWIDGDLIFPPGEWLIKGKKPKVSINTDSIELIVLTQGLADHAHIPSLKLFSKSTKVIASEEGEKILKDLGFKDVEILSPGKSTFYKELSIEATQGAAIPKVENGYLIKHPNYKTYIEPHGFLDENIETQSVDLAITPIVNIGLPLIPPFIQGKNIIPKIVEKLNPRYMLASTTGGDVIFSGLLGNLFAQEGSSEDAYKVTSDKTKLIIPDVGKEYVLK